MLYVDGGLALANFGLTSSAGYSDNSTGAGWTIGAGIEYAITQNLLGRVEYLYDHFGHKDYIGSDGDPYRVSLTGSTVRGALAWKF